MYKLYPEFESSKLGRINKGKTVFSVRIKHVTNQTSNSEIIFFWLWHMQISMGIIAFHWSRHFHNMTCVSATLMLTLCRRSNSFSFSPSPLSYSTVFWVGDIYRSHKITPNIHVDCRHMSYESSFINNIRKNQCCYLA